MATAPTIALQPGSTDTAAVKQLQDYLVSIGYMTQPQVNTGYGTYGPQTTAAVLALQKAKGVDYSSGPGYYGPKTITAITGSAPTGSNQTSAPVQTQTTSQPSGSSSPSSGSSTSASGAPQGATQIIRSLAGAYYADASGNNLGQVSGSVGNDISSGVTNIGGLHVNQSSNSVLPPLFSPSSNNQPPPDQSSSNSSGTTSTGDPNLDATLSQLQGYIDKLTASGQVLNPAVQLTPEKIAEFTAQAQSEINPYYASQLKLARASLLQNAGYSASEIQNNEAQLAKQYNIQFQQVGANAADQGFAQSGKRVLDENTLASDTQNTIDTNRRQLANTVGNSINTFAQNYGSANVPDITIGNAPSFVGGEPKASTPSGVRSLYTLDPNVYNGLIGSQQYQQNADVLNRTNQLSQAFNSNAALQQQRSLTL